MSEHKTKRGLLATSMLFGISGGLWAPAAIAQEADDAPVAVVQEEEGEARQDLVVITGSRIQRPDIESVFPTTSIDTQTLQDRAFTNIADALNEIPAFGGGVDPLGGQGANIGANFVDFLDLGVQRTLTLVNGRRFVSADVSGNGLSVDFNVIPIALVERIDTIGVGGAPIYGSDAIAGTINVILKDDFEGFDVTGQYGITERGDAESYQVQIAAGANTADGRGNVTFSVEYFNQDGLLDSDRPEIFTNEPFLSEVQPGTAGFTDIDVDGDGTPDPVFRRFNLDGSAGQNVALFTLGGVISPGALFLPNIGLGSFGGDFFQFADNGDLVEFIPGAPIPGQSLFFQQGGTPFDFFDLAGQVQSPLERIVFGSTMRYDLFEGVRFKADAQLANTQSTELANQGGFQTFAFGGLSSNLVLPASNPFLNQQARDTLASIGVGPTDTFNLQRFNNDFVDSGARTSETFVWRISAGLEGDFNFAGREFRWEVFGVAGEATNETQNQPTINDTRFLNAIEAVQLTQTDIDNGAMGSVGDIVCQVTRDFQTGVDPTTIRGIVSGSGVVDDDPADVTQCQPLNLFGVGNASQEAIDFVIQNGTTQTNLDQTVFNANIGGQLIELPAGWASFSAGYETRRESGTFTPDSGVEIGTGRGAAVPPTGGSYSTDEFFGELFVPLVNSDLNIPLVNEASFEASIRQIDNSLAGDATVWTVGGSYKPVPDLTIRGNRTRSVRAPSITELFLPIVTTFAFADDPCDARFINDGQFAANRAANCAAIGITQPFTSNIVNATAMGTTGGNPNLLNETANSFSVGILAQPRWVPGLTLKADYIDIELSDAIGPVTVEANLESCFDSDPADFASNPSCNTFTRDANFQIVDFQEGQLNADQNDVRFLLLGADYRFDVADAFNLFGGNASGDWGQFGMNMNVSHVLERTIVLNGVLQDNTIGSQADPRWSGTNDFTYTKGGLRMFWRILWQDRDLFSPSGNNFFADENDVLIDRVGGRVVHNASVAYDFSELMPNYDNPFIVQLNVNNVLDRSPGRGLDRVFGNFFPQDELGRTFTVRVRASF